MNYSKIFAKLFKKRLKQPSPKLMDTAAYTLHQKKLKKLDTTGEWSGILATVIADEVSKRCEKIISRFYDSEPSDKNYEIMPVSLSLDYSQLDWELPYGKVSK